MTTIETHASGAASSRAGVACVAEWGTTTDHKQLGRMYLGTALLALLGSGVVATLLAVERVDTSGYVLNINALTQMFSLYRFGFTYLVMLPAIVGLAIAAVPLQLGARSLALPRLAAAGFWLWLLGGVLSIVALASNGGPDGGNARFVDLFTLAAAITIVGLLASTVSLATTVLTTRAPGLSVRRIPLFSWSVFVMSVAVIIGLAVVVGNLLVVFVAHKYPSLSELSGNRALGEWAGFGFTQPTVLLFSIPVLGFLADVVVAGSSRRLRSRGALQASIALVGVAVLGAAMQSDAALPAAFRDLTGSQKVQHLIPFVLVNVLPFIGVFLAVVLALSSLSRRPAVVAPLVFGVFSGALALLGAAGNVVFHIGDAGLAGTTFEEGVWLALVYSAVLAAMGGVVYWGPKWWGRRIPNGSAAILGVAGALAAVLASVPMMIAGFADQPGAVFPSVGPGEDSVVRFSYSGPSGLWNVLSAAGHGLMLVVVIAFVAVALRSFRKGERAGDDPWDGQTLEWATTSPAPADNFADMHLVQSAEPLLDLKRLERSDV